MGKVHMQVEYDGHVYYGFGANTDIVAASVEAYIDCINKFVKSQLFTGFARECMAQFPLLPSFFIVLVYSLVILFFIHR